MKKTINAGLLLVVLIFFMGSAFAQRQMENLDRGLVAVKVSSGVFLSWRVLGTEWSGVSYNLYRGSTLLNSSPITGATNYTDAAGTTSSTYYVKAVISGVEQAASPTVSVWASNYLDIPLQIPAGLTMPDATTCTYSPNDCSVGDVNGDGKYEIIVKWDPSNSKDNSLSGYTGNVYLDAYTLSGTRLWRIDLGKNIRAGAHYTQFMVYDFDGDGKAEVVCKTAPGTIDGTGAYLTGAAAGTNNATDYRNSSGYILTGPEYLTIFNGQTGKELQTINYEVARGTVSGWGDSYGNRVDRFLAGVAYLDGKTPSIVMCRGYYTRAYIVTYKWNGTTLTKQWSFDSNTSGNSGYAGQGCHSLCVGDVDGDGFDEIVYGACTIDHNGAGLYTTGLGHGDALHLGDFNPDRAGLEVWQVHENASTNGNVAGSFRDAKTGSVIWKYTGSSDEGRGMAADIDASTKGVECWGINSGLFSATGTTISTSRPATVNFGIWWDGDDQRELLNNITITKYGGSTLLTATDCASNNTSKATPNLSADILGDWREELILRTSDNTKLRIFTTTTETTRRLYTLMHDPIYRLGIAWQNVAYNQPPDVSFYLGGGMSTAPTPSIYLAGGVNPATLTKHGAGSSSQTITLGTALTSYYYTWANATSVTVSGLPSGVTSVLDATAQTVTISGTPTVAGIFTYTITTTGGTTNASVSGTITVNSSSTSTLIYQGEDAVINTGVAETKNAGYTGTGYANADNAIGAYVEWTVTTTTAGSFSIFFRYASLGDRPADIYVNGTKVISALAFSTTGDWTTWSTTATQTVTLLNGVNTIRATATTADGCANLDYLQVTGGGTLKSTSVNSIAVSPDPENFTVKIYPNPLTVNSNIMIELAKESSVSVRIFSLQGKVVQDISETNYAKGSHSLKIHHEGLSKGLYLCKVTINGQTKTMKMVVTD